MCGCEGGAEGLLEAKAGLSAHKAHHHPISAHGMPQIDMAHKAPAACFVVYTGARLLQQAAHSAQDGGKQRRLKGTAFARHHAVAARGIKSGADMPIAIAAKRILRFVAVALHAGRRQDGQNFTRKPPDAAHGVGHKALFLNKLFFI